MLTLNHPETRFMLDAVRQASLLVRNIQCEMVTPSLQKNDLSPVTVADFAAQALIGRLLSQAFPDDPMVGEEDSASLHQPEGAEALSAITRFLQDSWSDTSPEKVCAWIDHARVNSARRFWTLDPIDGTKGFLRGDQYAIALALVVEGQVVAGALGCPNLVDAYRPDLEGSGSLVAALRGQGTWVSDLGRPEQWQRLHVSDRSQPAQARLLRSFESGHTNVSQIDLFSQALGSQAAPVLMDSQAKYAVLAAGKGDIILRLLSADKPNYREKIWDQAAGSIILEEAGGQISDLHGRALDFTTGRSLTNNRGILASNTLLHPASLQALVEIGA